MSRAVPVTVLSLILAIPLVAQTPQGQAAPAGPGMGRFQPPARNSEGTPPETMTVIDVSWSVSRNLTVEPCSWTDPGSTRPPTRISRPSTAAGDLATSEGVM